LQKAALLPRFSAVAMSHQYTWVMDLGALLAPATNCLLTCIGCLVAQATLCPPTALSQLSPALANQWPSTDLLWLAQQG